MGHQNIRPDHIRDFLKTQDVRTLLTFTNPKVLKNDQVSSIPTAVMHLLPNYRGTCPFAGTCAEICLHRAGNPAYMRGKQAARRRRTDAFMNDRARFMEYLLIELLAFASKHPQSDVLGVRLNGTSDIRWERESIEVHPETSDYIHQRFNLHIAPGRYRNIMYCLSTSNNTEQTFQFYDYTKRTDRLWDVCRHDNYHLTLSVGSSGDTFRQALDESLNLAAAFNIKKNEPFPATVTHNGIELPVVDGDVTDYRPHDPSKRTHIVGLRIKRVPGMTPEQVKAFCIQ